ncbi:MAG TPA: LysR substrate-binding domain-containing protein, partial [Thermodesulfobacteriota bacterium]
MNLHRLRVFRAVAERMSFSAAAEQLYLTQPAVSLQVRALERSLGVRLFDRTGGRLALTPAGEALLRSAATILNAEDEARRVIDELRGASAGRLIVAANTTGGMYLVPRLIAAFRAEAPRVQIDLDVDATDRICERVAQGMVDLGFVGGPIEDRRLAVEPVVDDRLVLIASPANPLAQRRRRRLSLERLAAEPLIVPEPASRTRLLVERRLREAGLPFRPAAQMVGTEAVKKAVEANLGVAFVSSYAVEGELALGRLVRLELDDFAIVRPIVMV